MKIPCLKLANPLEPIRVTEPSPRFEFFLVFFSCKIKNLIKNFQCILKDDDEGIDVRTEGCTSSTSCASGASGEQNRKNRGQGQYNYELFSIMIHSGSASGGHYYAYIKDFPTGEW